MVKNIKPYIAGALVGILAVFSAVMTTKLSGKTSYLGVSTTFAKVAGFTENFLNSGKAESMTYYKAVKLSIDWQFMLVIGIFAGSFLSSVTDKSFKIELVPPLWQSRFGSSKIKRAVFSFMGGVIAAYGARMADGCPSGHGLSGLMQLSASSLVAMMLFFVSGIITANIIYKRGVK